MQGTIHEYYTIALAPGIAGVIAITARELWRSRETWTSRIIAAILIAVTAWWDIHLLGTSSSFLPWLRYALAVGAAVAIFLILMVGRLRKAVTGTALVALLVGLGGPAAYAIDTASKAHTGAIPTSGPSTSAMGGFGGGAMPSGMTRPTGSGTAPTGSAPAMGGSGPTTTATSSTALTALLKATTTRWAAATIGSQSAATYQLSSGKAVMAIGGFTGSDNSPTLAQFEKWVAEGKISYFISGGVARGDSGTGSQISSWVTAHYTATTVGGTTVYDLRVAAK